MLANIILDAVGVRRNGAELFQVPHLTIAGGRILAVLGENGCGTGAPRFFGLAGWPGAGFQRRHSLRRPTPRHYFQGRNRPRDLLLLAQEPLLFDYSVGRNLAYGLRLDGRSNREAHERVADVLGRLNIHGLAKRRATRLSGGEKRRVALARVW